MKKLKSISKKFTFCIFFILSFCLNASALVIPIHSTYVSYDYDVNPQNAPQGFWNMDTHLTWKKEPISGWGYYAQMYFWFEAGVGGYMGLQKDNNGKRAIFSMWDKKTGAINATPAHSNCQRFGHEGAGTQCFAMNFNWEAGRDYKLRLWKGFNSSLTWEGNSWSAWVIDTVTGVETYIGTIHVDDAPGFIGYGNLSTSGHITTPEYYIGDLNATCDQLPYFGVEWKGPFMNNGSINPLSARVQYDTGMGTKCNNTNIQSKKPLSVTQEAGGKTVPTPHGSWENIWVNNPSTPVCTLSASPASINAGGTSVLTTSCKPYADSYFWIGGTCAGNTAATCTVTPSITTSYSVAGINVAGTGTVASATVIATTRPSFTLNPRGLSFAAQVVGSTSPAQTVILSNSSAAILNITSIIANGDFAHTTTCGVTLAQAASCSISVTFKPTSVSVQLSSLVITSNAASIPNTVSLNGTGTGTVSAPMISGLPASLNFGTQNVGSTSAAQTITLTNSGTTVLNIASIVANGDFARTTTCGVLMAQAASCTVSVTFKPTTAGGKTGSLIITSNAASSPNAVSLSGTGTASGTTCGKLPSPAPVGDIDTVVYPCQRSSYTLTKTDTDWLVTSAANSISDFLPTGFDRIQFADRTVALDISGNAGQAYRIYQAAFNRTPDNGGLKYWINAMDTGTSLEHVSAGFVTSPEFLAMYGANPTNSDFLIRIYDNVLHRTPDQSGYDWWLGQLNTGAHTRVSVLTGFSESPENQAGVLGAISNGIDLLN